MSIAIVLGRWSSRWDLPPAAQLVEPSGRVLLRCCRNHDRIRSTVGHRFLRWFWVGLLRGPGAGRISGFPAIEGETKDALGETDIWSLVERDLARWLARHVGIQGA